MPINHIFKSLKMLVKVLFFLLNSAAWISAGLMGSQHSLSLMGMTDRDASEMKDASSGMLGVTVYEYDLTASATISSSSWQNGRAKSHPLKEAMI